MPVVDVPVHTAPKMFLDVFLSPWRVGGVFGRMFMTLSICQKYVLRKNGTEILKAGHEREICIGRIFAMIRRMCRWRLFFKFAVML